MSNILDDYLKLLEELKKEAPPPFRPEIWLIDWFPVDSPGGAVHVLQINLAKAQVSFYQKYPDLRRSGWASPYQAMLPDSTDILMMGWEVYRANMEEIHRYEIPVFAQGGRPVMNGEIVEQ